MSIGPKLRMLLSISSPSIVETAAELTDEMLQFAGAHKDDYLRLLADRNGFYAFESALHVFGCGESELDISVNQWNSEHSWRQGYNEKTENRLFFAEDVFGGQFCLMNDKIYTFDPETGNSEYLADDYEHWAQLLLKDFDLLTGYPLAREWQEQNGPIPIGRRLYPKLPFFLGGEFAIENLYCGDPLERMRFSAEIARQVADLPDGAEFKFKFTE